MKKLFFLVATLFPAVLLAQGVKISPTSGNADPSAILELQDSTKGFLMTRVTTAQRNAIVNPAVGLQIYNSTTNCIDIYFPSGWKQTVCECNVAPLQPGNITGPAQFCVNQQGIQYSIAPVANATSYTWTVPPGATIATGQGTATITVNFGASGGNVTVTANNSCGVSPVRQTSVSPSVPSASFTPTQASVGFPVTFTPQAGYVSYSWTFQNGNPATSFLQNPQVTWSSPGVVSVSLTIINSFGCTVSATQQVNVVSCLGTATYTFTSCGANGRTGPTQQDCDNTYGPAVVTSINGIQEWVVPNSTCPNTVATFEAWGAQGGSTNGGLGAYIKGSFTINPGDVFRILVGQQGLFINNCSSGSGGGTFIVKNVGGNYTPYIVAGGGGAGNNSVTGGPGLATLSGSPNGGTGGSCSGGGAGGGYQTDGAPATCGGQSFINGGLGGTNIADGGFGGGGSSNAECDTGMDLCGGGGYQGGNGGNSNGAGVGGQSFNSGTNQTNTSGVQAGNGRVVISW